MTTEPARRPDLVLKALQEACAAHPDQRVAQVLVNAVGFNDTFTNVRRDPFYVEDLDLAQKLTDYARAAT